jgi:phosphoribosyl-dephospho-CoA transferase
MLINIMKGAQYTEAFSKKNTHLVAKTGVEDMSAKSKKAREWRIPVMSIEWIYSFARKVDDDVKVNLIFGMFLNASY